MIFSHMQEPLGMRQIRIGKRIYVHGVPLDTSCFCPYCCATVDTAFVILGGTGSRTRTSARMTHLLGYSRPPLSFRDVSGRNHEETWAGCIVSVNAYYYPGTIGVLSLLVAYIVVNVGALRFLFLSRRVRAWEAIVPVVALAILIYVIYANVYPVPDFPFNVFPYIVAAWLILGLGIVLVVPGLARRIGANLAQREGLTVEESPRS
jgi:hypothetical protein